VRPLIAKGGRSRRGRTGGNRKLANHPFAPSDSMTAGSAAGLEGAKPRQWRPFLGRIYLLLSLMRNNRVSRTSNDGPVERTNEFCLG
jgi:hypothetical protein